jgi:hypothetical protein
MLAERSSLKQANVSLFYEPYQYYSRFWYVPEVVFTKHSVLLEEIAVTYPT